MTATEEGQGTLRAPHVLEYPYRRSLGPVLSRFFTALKEHRIEGIRTTGGAVIVPPQEYDPETGETLTNRQMVAVGPGGEVVTWCWVTRPRAKQPLDRPFAWALIRLDGATAPMLHAVDAGDAARMRNGMRVKARWAAEPQGTIRDLACFEPEGA